MAIHYTQGHAPNLEGQANGANFTGNHDLLIGILANRIRALSGKSTTVADPDLSLATINTLLLRMGGYIQGLRLNWNSPGTNANNITVNPGEAWVPGANSILSVTGNLTPASLAFSANTWYYVYLKTDGTLDVTTVGPAVYKGTAKTRTSDNTSRYLGAVRTDASGAMHKFYDQVSGPLTIRTWLAKAQASPFNVISNGSATTPTNISCANVVPQTSRMAHLWGENYHSTTVVFCSPDDPYTLYADTQSYRFQLLGTTGDAAFWMQLNSSQQFTYRRTAAGSDVYVSVVGYMEER